MRRLPKALLTGACLGAVALTALTVYIAFPTTAPASLPEPLQSADNTPAQGEYSADLEALQRAFRPQRFRSFCGPASVATVLRAYGIDAEQSKVFPSLQMKADTFFSGMSLAELQQLAQSAGLTTERIHADSLTLDGFRDKLKRNLEQAGNYVLVNYDRQTLKQDGAGHISPVGAYDSVTDRFLVLDEATYKYPFTWVPAHLLYDAVHTQAGEGWRGILLIHSYSRRIAP